MVVYSGMDPSNADALALAVQGYKQKGGGKILVTTKIVHADGTVEIFGSDATWKANCLDGAARQECCLGGNYHAPRENWALDAFPAGWTGATFDDASWEPAAAQKAFAPLEAKASRPVGRFDDWHRAVAITEVKETVCAAAPQNERLYLTCNGTSTIEAVVFADFGAPSGACAAPRGAAAAGMIPTQNANASGSPANSFETDATCMLMDPVFKHLNGLVEYDARRAGGVKKCRYAGDLTFTRQLVAKGPRWFKDIEVDVFGEKEDPLLQVSVSESHIPDGNGLTGELTKLAAGPVVDALQVVAFYDGGELRFIKTPAFDEAVTALRFVVQPAGVPDPTDVAALRRWGFNDAPMELECTDLGKCWKLLPANQKYASGGDLDFWKYHDLATTSAMLCAGRVVPRKEHGRIWRGCLALYARTPGWALRLERTRVGGRPKLELLALTKSIRKQIPKLLDYSRAGVVSGIGGSYALHHLMSENGTSAGWEPNDIDYYHIRHGDAASRLGDSIAAFKAALVADDGPFPGGVTLEMDDVTRLAHLYPPVDNLRPTIVNDFLPKITFLDGVTGGRHQVKMEKISFIEIETGNPANVTLEAILASYDIDVCSVGMRFVDGEWRFICGDDAAAAIEAKTMTVREGRVTKRTMPRVKKYKSRGFSLSEAGTGALTAGVLAL